jgi:hypothetical protein
MRRQLTSLLLTLTLLCALPLRAFAAAPVAASFATAVVAAKQNALQLQGSDADGTTLTYAIASGPAHGTISQLNTSTGALVYTPTGSYTGADSFSYTVVSGGDTSTAGTVTLTVTSAWTRIVDTLTNPDGTARSGKVTFILTQAASSPSGLIPANATVSAQLDSTGRFDVSLYPSRAVSPVQYYQVWFVDSSGNQQLLGVYDIPAATSTVTLSGYKVTNANLAATYTFASKAEVDALTQAVAAALTAQPFSTLTVTGDASVGGEVSATSFVGDGSQLTNLPGGVDPLVSDLAAYYKLDDASDASGGNNLTPSNGPTFGAGKIGNAAYFDAATDQALAAPDSAALSMGAEQSFSAFGWVWLSSESASNMPIVVKGTLAGNSTDEYALYYNVASHRFKFFVVNGGSLTVVTATSAGDPTLNAWNFVYAEHNATANTISIQINNGTVDSASHTAGVLDGSGALTLGSLGGTNSLDGRLDEVGIARRVLTTSERTLLYNSGAGHQPSFPPVSSFLGRTGNVSLLSSDLVSLNVPRYFNVKGYGASGSAARTTTVGTTSAGTSVTVTDGSTYSAGQGIFIDNAAAAGADYVGTVVSRSGNTITITPATSVSVSAGTTVQHDDRAAINATIAAAVANKGGAVYFPNGRYRVNGAVDSSTESLLTFPARTYGIDRTLDITFLGESVTLADYPLEDQGVVIDAEQASGVSQSGTRPAVVAPAAYNSAFTGHAAAYHVNFQNVMVVVEDNPTMTGLNLHQIPGCRLDNVAVQVMDASGIPPAPTTSTSYGIIYPGEGNDAHISNNNVFVQGFYTGIRFSEHMHADAFEMRHCRQAIEMEAGFHRNYGNFLINHCGTMLKVVGVSYGYFHFDIERVDSVTVNTTYYGVQTYDVVDASNQGHVKIEWHMVIAGTGISGSPPTKQGGATIYFKSVSD